MLLKPFYSNFLAVPHADKRGVEEVLAYCAGWEWEVGDSPGEEVLGREWEAGGEVPGPGTVKNVLVIRPALLTDGACRADAQGQGKEPYKVEEGDLSGRWTVSRKDVAHFVVERVIKHWDDWKWKRVSIAY